MSNGPFNGIPEDIKPKIFPVSDEKRINPLSHEPGGDEIVVVFNNGAVFYYDKIKYIEGYVEATMSKHPEEIERMFLKVDGESSFNEINFG